LATLPPGLVGMEACCGAHHLGRALASFGHTVRLRRPASPRLRRCLRPQSFTSCAFPVDGRHDIWRAGREVQGPERLAETLFLSKSGRKLASFPTST
jgi:hypothetical protein